MSARTVEIKLKSNRNQTVFISAVAHITLKQNVKQRWNVLAVLFYFSFISISICAGTITDSCNTVASFCREKQHSVSRK